MVKPIQIMLCTFSLLVFFDGAQGQTYGSDASLPNGQVDARGWVSIGSWRVLWNATPIKASDGEASKRLLANSTLRVAIVVSGKVQSRGYPNDSYQTAFARFVDKEGCDKLAAQGALCIELPTTKYVEMMAVISKQLDAIDKSMMERLATQDRLIAELSSELAALRAVKPSQ
ncbi:hypothetical protein AWB67_06556 [Caballeronia terrestris]|uniref:Uncharacterized protein n=1 Tax=Caballeronia terrestris TaxID=1226301 RepID=A0A158KSA0_9BURK|nr:hypothetical protein [Caballeronia terrestris]SAL83987.1 hypothetical protein AWB67_06556 [Caballeronia terrestris]